MLGRTANNVYWMARYVERAENMARLLASTYHMSLLPASNGNALRHWEAPLSLGGARAKFDERYGAVTPGNVLAHMALDGDNPASIISCVREARENARETRTNLTTEVWEGINQTYLELEGISYSKMVDQGFQEFFDWVKERSHSFRGAIYGTMRRGDAFNFTRLGTFVERADNTARFLSIGWETLSTGGKGTLGGPRGLLPVGRVAEGVQRLQGIPRGVFRHHRAEACRRAPRASTGHAPVPSRLHGRNRRYSARDPKHRFLHACRRGGPSRLATQPH